MAERFGRYTLQKRLGAGGMGEVFLAQPVGSEGTGHFVVVKTLLPQLAEDEKLVQMFLKEARLASQLDHPNICRVVDLGQQDGVLFMALEHVRGVDLEKLQRDATDGVPVPLALRIIGDAARGLDHAHRLVDDDGVLLGLVHRDVSPHNLLVSFDGQVKVIDFGLAKTVGLAQQSHTGSLKGKFAYMSPEMVRAERIDQRVDVFALGIVLHELLTGQRLFRQESDVATLAAIVRCEVPPPSQLNPQVPPELDDIVLKALAPARPKRFQTAGELADALDDLGRRLGGHLRLSDWMRQLYRDRLETESARGLLHDAPSGAVMKARPLSPPPVDDLDFEPPEARPTDHDAPTEKAQLDEDGVPMATGAVKLAPMPVLTDRPKLAAAPPPRKRPTRPPVDFDDERSLSPDTSPFELLRQEALRLTASRAVATTPPAPRPEAVATAVLRLPEAEPARHQSTWLGLGIGLALAAVVFAVLFLLS